MLTNDPLTIKRRARPAEMPPKEPQTHDLTNTLPVLVIVGVLIHGYRNTKAPEK